MTCAMGRKRRGVKLQSARKAMIVSNEPKEPTSHTIYSEIAKEDSAYRLDVVVFNDSPDTYWDYIFKKEPACIPEFWLSVNAGERRIKPGEFSEGNFERILPPCYNTAEEAIRNGKILLSHYAKEKRSDLNFFLP